jgi:hypothetical protein
MQQPAQHVDSVGLIGADEVAEDRREGFGVGDTMRGPAEMAKTRAIP